MQISIYSNNICWLSLKMFLMFQTTKKDARLSCGTHLRAQAQLGS